MSTYTKLIWPVQDVAAVCVAQNLDGSGPWNFILNGTLVNLSTPNQISFARQNMIRSVSITSTGNFPTTNFTIQGFQNQAFVTETLSGLNNNTIYGTKYYDIITSVTSSTSIPSSGPKVSIGTGNKGYFQLLVVNPNTTNINYSATVLLPSGSGINYSLLQTLDQVIDNFITIDDQLTKFFPCMGLTSQTTSQIGSSTNISNFILLKINNSANPDTDTFNFIFLQQ